MTFSKFLFQAAHNNYKSTFYFLVCWKTTEKSMHELPKPPSQTLHLIFRYKNLLLGSTVYMLYLPKCRAIWLKNRKNIVANTFLHKFSKSEFFFNARLFARAKLQRN